MPTILSGDPISIHRVISLSAGARAGTAECRHSSITRSRWFVLAAVQLLTCSCWGFESLCVGGKNKVDLTKISVLEMQWYITLGAIIFENDIINHDFLSVFKWGLPTSTSIFSAISASILKISVPINKRRSWRFRNTPRNQLSDEYWPRKQQKTKWLSKLNKTPIFGDLPFSLNCCNLA